MIGWPRVRTKHVGMCLRCMGPLVQTAERYGCYGPGSHNAGHTIFQPDRHEYCASRTVADDQQRHDIEHEWRELTNEKRLAMLKAHDEAERQPAPTAEAQQAQRDIATVDP